MLNSYYRLTVPDDLAAYYHVSDIISNNTNCIKQNSFSSDMLINRDFRGRVTSVKYFSIERELVKEVFYKAESINKINYYRGSRLYSTESYKNDLLVSKFIYKSDGHLAHSYEYEYNKKNKITGITKNWSGENIHAQYTYDDFERIVSRVIYRNRNKLLEQYYKYDILDRIIEYKDDNQQINVNKVNKKQELISYVITDKIGNKITVENIFTDTDYDYTKITLNDHCSTVKNKSYVDNVMLKKPYTTEDDLDLIIANLFNDCAVMNSSRESSFSKNASKIIDNNIEHKVLPISIRKRLLYNIAVKI